MIRFAEGPKLRGGPLTAGVEGLPAAGGPLDPGSGLGGILSVGLFWANASPFLKQNSHFVTAVTGPSPIRSTFVDLRVRP